MTRLPVYAIVGLLAVCVVVSQGCSLQNSTSAYVASYGRNASAPHPGVASSPRDVDNAARHRVAREPSPQDTPEETPTTAVRSIRSLLDAVVVADNRIAPRQVSAPMMVASVSARRRPIYHHMAATGVPTYGVNSSSSSPGRSSGPPRKASRHPGKAPTRNINRGYAPRGTNALTNRWWGRDYPRYYRTSGSGTYVRVYYGNGGTTIRTYTTYRR